MKKVAGVTKKLGLSRETLADLEHGSLHQANGGTIPVPIVMTVIYISLQACTMLFERER